jgi:hypothetical protein
MRRLTVQQVWARMVRIRPTWERAWAAKDWRTCSRCKKLYDRLWDRHTGAAEPGVCR